MNAAPPLDLAEKLRTQIARMVTGNGLPPESVTTRTAQETLVKLNGQLDIRLTARAESTQGKGAAPVRWNQTFNAIADLTAAAPMLPAQLAQDAARLQHAADQILHQPHQGWGLTVTEIPTSPLDFTVGASEVCAQCHGEKTTLCANCNGLRRQECPQCFGRKEVTCPTCGGRMVMAGGEDCSICRHRGTVPCVTCQGQGEMSCTACAGKGQTPCRACDAKGQLWHQIIFHTAAQTNFKMMLAAELPEETMRHVRRLRPENLLDGRARITVTNQEISGDTVRVNYAAEFPIVQLEFSVADQPVHLTMLGEKPTILEATHFMDGLLAQSLDLLRRARQREVLAAAALGDLGKLRFYREALSPGKNSMELRRRYPFGISQNLLREVPSALHYLLSILTAQPRMLAAAAFNAVAAMLLLYLYGLNASKGHFGMGDILLLIVLLLLNTAAIAGTHIAVSAQTLRPFGVQPKLELKYLPTALGDAGIFSLAGTALMCIIAWLAK